MTIQIHGDPITVNCRKVFAGMKLLGADFENHHVDYFTGGQKSPAYVAINPMASLPALVDGDLKLWESNAILQYVADKKGDEAHYPRDLKTRADIHRWMLWESNAWFPSTYVYLVENVVKPLLKAQPDKSITDKEEPNFHKLAGILDARLAKQKWLAGDGNHVTIADIAVAAPMHLYKWQKLPLDEHPNLKRWMADVEQLPCWKATADPLKALIPA
jgi:glutathione S-transferase